MAADDCRIWSFEHQAWWGPNERGYVRCADDAGVYPRADANRLVAAAYPGHEIAILVKDAGAWELEMTAAGLR